MKDFLVRLIPKPLLQQYHYAVASLGAIYYGHPSREMFVVAVTGTKGKSTTSELLAAILRASGYKVALASTIHFVIDDKEERNLYKMTMPGRARLQAFLRRAKDAGCTHAVVEMTSEGAAQYRHVGVELDALVFLNIAPEHLESHGGFEQYLAAKLSLATHLEQSHKRPRIIVANVDDPHGEKFLDIQVERKVPFTLEDAAPYSADDRSVRFVWRRGELFTVPLPGLFNLQNCLAALAFAEAVNIPVATTKKVLEHIPPIAGRAQRIESGQPFGVIVDYAHTPDSLRAILSTYGNTRVIGIIGSTGGGRDTWNRPEKGKIAEEFCDVSIITNEDPYNEDPQKILIEIAGGFADKKPLLILDRREAIARACKEARPGDTVVITGKGTDPYIMGPRGSKEVWSDVQVAKEELEKLGYH